jgi:hypothetical protein
MEVTVSVCRCEKPDVLVTRSPVGVIVLASAAGGGSGFAPSERTIARPDVDKAVRKRDDLGVVLLDATAGAMTGANACVFSTLLGPPLRVMFMKVDLSPNEAQVVNENGERHPAAHRA